MRKIFVVLLVLAIAGGALAQEAEDKGTWGTWSGSVELRSSFDLTPLGDNNDATKTIVSGNNNSGDLDNGPIDASLNLAWDYVKGDWTIHLPFDIDENGIDTMNDDGDALAYVQYASGPLTVKLPFAIAINKDINLTTFPFGWVQKFGVSATYTVENEYEFSFGADLQDGKTWLQDLDNDPVGFKAHGWYQFDENGSRLAVSYNSGSTEWWSATGLLRGVDNIPYTLKPHLNDDDEVIAYHWENIGADADYNAQGLAFRFNVTPDISFGAAFVGTDMFEASGAPADRGFFNHFVFGAKAGFGPVAASFVLGLEPSSWYDLNKANPDLYPNFNGGADGVDMYMHLGLKFDFADLGLKGLTVDAAGAMAVYRQDQNYYDWYNKDRSEGKLVAFKPYMGLALEVKFFDEDSIDGENDFVWAKFGVKGLNILNNDENVVKYNDFYLDNYGNTGGKLNLVFQVGGKYKLDQITVGLWAGIELNSTQVYASNPEAAYNNKFTGDMKPYWWASSEFAFEIHPSISWNLIENGSIELGYNAKLVSKSYDGITVDPQGSYTTVNNVTLGFKWSF